MCPCFLIFTAGLIISLPSQTPLTESQAVAYLQQLPARQVDGSLPAAPFGSWIKQAAGDQAGVTWILTECGNPAQGRGDGDIPACIEVNAMVSNSRKFAVVVEVGSFRQGLAVRPRLQFAVIEDKGKLFAVPALRDLTEMLRMRVIRPKRKAVSLPQLPAARVPLWFNFSGPGDYRRMVELSTYQPPHVTAPAPAPTRVSDGALIGSVITRVVPEYPIMARQNRITGQVLVQVTIAEDGRVVEAVAISGPPVLRSASEEAARKWIFKPTILNGVPIRVQGNLTFVFSQP